MNKLIVPAALLLFLVVGSFCLSYFDKVDRANVEFQHARLLTEQAQESLLARHKMLEHRNKVQSGHLANRNALTQAEARVSSAEQKQLELLQRRQRIQSELDRLIATHTLVIDGAKRRAQGTDLLTINLRGGKTLSEARLRKIDETSASIVHADGISSIPLVELPEKLQLQLGLDGTATLNALKKLRNSLTTSPPLTCSRSEPGSLEADLKTMRRRHGSKRKYSTEEPLAESSPWWVVAPMLALVCGGAGLWYLDVVERSRLALETTRLKVAHLRRTHAAVTQASANRDAATRLDTLFQQKLRAAEVREEQASMKLSAAAGRTRAIKTELRSLITRLDEQILRAESAWRKLDIPELRLRNGMVLHDVRLGAQNGDRWNLTHSEGVGAISFDDIPVSLLEKFDVRSFTVLEALKKLDARLNPESSATENTVVSEKLAPLRTEMSLLEGALERLTTRKFQQEGVVRDYDDQIVRESNRAQATFSLRTLRDIAEGSAGQIRSEINKLEARLNSLRAQEKALLGEK